MNKLIDFYTDVASSLGLTISKDDFIKIEHGGKLTTMTAAGKPLVLPTKKHVSTLIDVDDEGKAEICKVLFNPLNEDGIKKDNVSFIKLKDIIERKLAHSFFYIGIMLLEVASDKALQKNTKLEINKFLTKLNDASTAARKELVDANTIKHWRKIYENSLKNDTNKGLLKIFMKKNGVHNGTKFYKLAVTDFPVLNSLKSLKETANSTDVLGVKLRNKDIDIFTILYNFIFTTMEENGTIVEGSNDTTSPAFISVFQTYISVARRLNYLAKSVTLPDSTLQEEASLPVTIEDDDLTNIKRFASDLAVIPSDLDTARESKVTQPVSGFAATMANSVAQPIAQQQPQQPYAPQQPMMPAPQEELSLAEKVLGRRISTNPQPSAGFSGGYNPLQQQPQQPYIPQRPIQQQPYMQQPYMPPQGFQPQQPYPQQPQQGFVPQQQGFQPQQGLPPQQGFMPQQQGVPPQGYYPNRFGGNALPSTRVAGSFYN